MLKELGAHEERYKSNLERLQKYNQTGDNHVVIK
jgi:hypothetical protein